MTTPASNAFERRVLPELLPGLGFYSAAFGGIEEFTAENLPPLRAALKPMFDAALAAVGPNDRVEITEYEAPGHGGAPAVPLRVYRPRAATGPLPCLYWIHGGGMVIGEAYYDDPDCCDYAEMVNCVVVSVDYRLAPEHPAPAATLDCLAGLRWTVDHADRLGIDASRLIVGGRSGGGNLAAGLTLMARDLGGPSIHYQLLVYPMLDDRNQTPSAQEFRNVVSWGARHNESAWRMVLGGAYGTPAVFPYSAPARTTDLSGLPPTFIQVGALEMFLDESIDYARRILLAGGDCELHVHPGAYHGADMFNPGTPYTNRVAQERYAALKRAVWRS